MRSLRVILVCLVLASAAIGLWMSRGLLHRPDAPRAGSAAPPVWTPVTHETLAHGRFKTVEVFSPHASPRGLILLLSGTDGWNPAMSDTALQLGAQGAMVVGIDLAQFDAVLDADGGACVYPDGDLENLSHFIQAYYRLPTYLSPILAGYAEGGAFAYATLAQAPANTFAAALSLGFCPNVPLHKPLCKGSAALANPWLVVEVPDAPRRDGPACDAGAVRNLMAAVPGARLIAAPTVAAEVDELLRRNAPASAAPDALKDLPIVEVAAQPGAGPHGAPPDAFAIMLSGDGGWAGIDKEVAAALSADGIPVVGLDSLRYFWSARTPQGLAADLDRIIQYYVAKLGKQHVLLVGYSQGADVLPFAVNRLSPAARAHVVLAAILGMSEHALFEFHMSSWVSDDNSGPATLPEVDRMTGMTVLCIYGEEETDSLCPRLDAHKATIVKVKGGHHFDGNYAALAQSILASARP